MEVSVWIAFFLWPIPLVCPEMESDSLIVSGANQEDENPKPSNTGNSRRSLKAGQVESIRRLREKTANGPVPKGLQKKTVTVGNEEREFFINVPEKVKGKPSPVVFVLHGGASNSGLAMHLKTDFTVLGSTEGYVTVYPSGTNGWNIGSHEMLSSRRRTSDADDVGFFRSMFDMLIAENIAKPNQIYLAGGSNGGVMTMDLVCHLSDRIAGAAVLVATLPRAAETKWPKPSRPVPIMIMLGTEDPMKPWEGNRDQMSAEETVAYWCKLNGCREDVEKWELPDRDTKDGCRAYAQRWDGKAPVLFYTLKDHGHGWPMQRNPIGKKTGASIQDISAPEEIWSFFKKTAGKKGNP